MENQEFRAFDILKTISALIVVVTTIAYIVGKKIYNPTMDEATLKARKISNQLLSGGLNSLNDSSHRGPASMNSFQTKVIEKIGEEGQISTDPWGRPYKFKFVRDEEKVIQYLVVTSSGPNRHQDTEMSKISYDSITKDSESLFSKDDVGVISSVNE